jgi:hypothetical protein
VSNELKPTDRFVAVTFTALKAAEKELENIAGWSGSSGNWPLQDALERVRDALTLIEGVGARVCIWQGSSGLEVWEALTTAPLVAGPWEEGRSGEMAVRRDIHGKIVATELWVEPMGSHRCPAGDRILADAILEEQGWLLANPTKEKT